MDTLETRLEKRLHVSLYALLFLTILLGLSVLLEGCTGRKETAAKYSYYKPFYKASGTPQSTASQVVLY
jgi:hypothetical protein